MKRIATLLLLLISFCTLRAQTSTFIGTLVIDNFTQKNITATMTVKNGVATCVIHDMKISKMVPMRFDSTIPGLKAVTANETTTVTGNNITPKVGNTGFDAFVITRFKGEVKGDNVSASCLMGDKKVTFTGKKK